MITIVVEASLIPLVAEASYASTLVVPGSWDILCLSLPPGYLVAVILTGLIDLLIIVLVFRKKDR